MSEERDTTKDLGVMFLCLVAGYGIAQYQNNKRSKNQICYDPITNSDSIPDMFADKIEEVIKAGGHAGVRRVGSLVELIIQTATGETEILREVKAATKDATDAFNPASGAGKSAKTASGVEYYDEKTKTWRSM